MPTGGLPSQGHTAAVEKSWYRFRASLVPPNTLPGRVVYRSPILGETIVAAATATRRGQAPTRSRPWGARAILTDPNGLWW